MSGLDTPTECSGATGDPSIAPADAVQWYGAPGIRIGGRRASTEDRISVDPAVCSGKPCIKGTRIMVRNIVGMLAGGYSVQRVLREYPQITGDDVAAALEYASRVVDEDKVIARR